MSAEDAIKILGELEPSERHRVMDLVAETGVNVDAWAVKRGGKPVANPAANPAYCYEWAFGTGSEPVALCIWHETLQVREGRISFVGNLRLLSLELESSANDRSKSEEFRSRAKAQAVRARDFDLRCQDAWRLKRPVRLILLKGERQRKTSLGQDSSKVEFRRLDPEPWTLTSYDMMTGDIHLVRGVASVVTDSVADSAPTASTSDSIDFSDQFDLESTPGRREAVGSVWIRSPQVRCAVLARARGVCEACGAQGFRMASGAVYLETHHVVPLSENGPDVVWNVVAVCPNDHRIAHYGEDREAWRNRMLRHLASLYPEVDGDRFRNVI